MYSPLHKIQNSQSNIKIWDQYSGNIHIRAVLKIQWGKHQSLLIYYGQLLSTYQSLFSLSLSLSLSLSPYIYICIHIYICVCVSVWERERERERNYLSNSFFIYQSFRLWSIYIYIYIRVSLKKNATPKMKSQN